MLTGAFVPNAAPELSKCLGGTLKPPSKAGEAEAFGLYRPEPQGLLAECPLAAGSLSESGSNSRSLVGNGLAPTDVCVAHRSQAARASCWDAVVQGGHLPVHEHTSVCVQEHLGACVQRYVC